MDKYRDQELNLIPQAGRIFLERVAVRNYLTVID